MAISRWYDRGKGHANADPVVPAVLPREHTRAFHSALGQFKHR